MNGIKNDGKLQTEQRLDWVWEQAIDNELGGYCPMDNFSSKSTKATK